MRDWRDNLTIAQRAFLDWRMTVLPKMTVFPDGMVETEWPPTPPEIEELFRMEAEAALSSPLRRPGSPSIYSIGRCYIYEAAPAKMSNKPLFLVDYPRSRHYIGTVALSPNPKPNRGDSP